MYNVSYNRIKNKCNDNLKILYMGNDSLNYGDKNKYFYDDVKSTINELDTSSYPINNVYNLALLNKNILGKFKIQLNGQLMEEFIGLRSKLNAYEIFENKKVAKKLTV
jgi:hypothetical protein